MYQRSHESVKSHRVTNRQKNPKIDYSKVIKAIAISTILVLSLNSVSTEKLKSSESVENLLTYAQQVQQGKARQELMLEASSNFAKAGYPQVPINGEWSNNYFLLDGIPTIQLKLYMGSKETEKILKLNGYDDGWKSFLEEKGYNNKKYYNKDGSYNIWKAQRDWELEAVASETNKIQAKKEGIKKGGK